MDGVKNIIFDLGGVLINLARVRCLASFEKLGVKDIRQRVTSDYRHKDLFGSLELGLVSVPEFREGIRHLSGMPMTDEQIDEAWISMLGDLPTYRLDLLLELRKSYRLFLLSNTNEIHWQWIEKNCFNYKGYHVADFFEKVYLSYELHMQKPDAEIFEYVLNDAGIYPEESFLVDDTRVNCRMAGMMGIRSYAPLPREDWSHIFVEQEALCAL